LALGERLPRRGEELVACGEFFACGTRVVLWLDPGGFDAYRVEPRFRAVRPDDVPAARYGSWRRQLPPPIEAAVRSSGWSLPLLQQVVTQLVIHYDAAGSAQRCFAILHDARQLSCHFLIDRDGTVYQTLDLKERAWHAGEANDCSIGVEMAQVGAYPDLVALAAAQATAGLPQGQPVVQGKIHGQLWYQHPFTNAQLEALMKLSATLIRVLPAIEPRWPGQRDTLAPAGFRGIVGHHHLTRAKVDPGPAFDWERYLAGVQRLLGEELHHSAGGARR
jgi:N-acetyl-anhydromuramyl-L-alanine amidase AmpD